MLPLRHKRARLANVDNNRGLVPLGRLYARGHGGPEDQDASDDVACPHADMMPRNRPCVTILWTELQAAAVEERSGAAPLDPPTRVLSRTPRMGA
jgi:hypothetical protein